MTTVHLRSSGELIAVVPALVGYEPSESLVVVGVTRGGGLGPVMRVDREACIDDRVSASVGESVAAALARDRCETAVIVSYTGESLVMECPAVERVLPAIAPVVEGFEIWACHAGRYWAPDCIDAGCCPPGGRRLPPPPRLPVNTGIHAHRLRHEAGPVGGTPAPASQRRRAHGAAGRWWRRRDRGLAQWRRQSMQLCTAFESSPEAADALAIGKMCASLQDIRVRDAVIVSWLGAGADVVSDVLDGVDSPAVGAVMDRALSRDRVGPLGGIDIVTRVEWCDALAGYAREQELPVIHTLAGIAWWWAGNLAASRAECTRALAVDPRYTLALLVEGLCVTQAAFDGAQG